MPSKRPKSIARESLIASASTAYGAESDAASRHDSITSDIEMTVLSDEDTPYWENSRRSTIPQLPSNSNPAIIPVSKDGEPATGAKVIALGDAKDESLLSPSSLKSPASVDPAKTEENDTTPDSTTPTPKKEAKKKIFGSAENKIAFSHFIVRKSSKPVFSNI
jgi:hypothetical protein